MTRGSPKRKADARWPVSTLGPLEPVKRLLRQDAVLTDALDFKELAIDLVTKIAQVG